MSVGKFTAKAWNHPLVGAFCLEPLVTASLAQVQMIFPIEPREVHQSQVDEVLLQSRLSSENHQRNIVRLGCTTHKLANLGHNGIYNFLRCWSPWLL
jgi:hypothetical protein